MLLSNYHTVLGNVIKHGTVPFYFYSSLNGVNPVGSLKETIVFDEEKRQWTIIRDLPGYKKEEIEIEVNKSDYDDNVYPNGVLEITAYNEERGGKTYDVALVDDVDEDKITAAYENGVLTVVIPAKPAPEPAPRKLVQIK